MMEHLCSVICQLLLLSSQLYPAKLISSAIVFSSSFSSHMIYISAVDETIALKTHRVLEQERKSSMKKLCEKINFMKAKPTIKIQFLMYG